MPTYTTGTDVARLATKLANLVADTHEAKRPIDKKVAEARLDGAAEVAHILGYGRTPSHVIMTANEWTWKNPRPQDLSAGQLDSKRWHHAVRNVLAWALLNIRND